MKLLFILLIFSFSRSVYSHTNESAQLTSQQTRIHKRFESEIEQKVDIKFLELLKTIGITEIQSVAIDDVIEGARNAQFKIVTDQLSQYIDKDGKVRKSGRYELDSSGHLIVYLSLDEAVKARGQKSRFDLQKHEILGPIDRTFAVTSLLRFADENNDFLNFSVDKLSKILNLNPGYVSPYNKLLAVRGGTSGVGGGGDYRIKFYIDWLYFLMFQKLKRGQLNRDQILAMTCVIISEFEFDISDKVQSAQIETHQYTTQSGDLHTKILFSPPQTFGSVNSEEILKEFDINFGLLTTLLGQFLQKSESSQVCNWTPKK